MSSMATVRVRAIAADDLPSVHAILEEWLRDPQSGEVLPGEVDSRIELIAVTLAGHPTRQFVVAVNGRGEILGVAGLQSDGIEPELCIGIERPVEIV
jgi:hypothetical protein